MVDSNEKTLTFYRKVHYAGVRSTSISIVISIPKEQAWRKGEWAPSTKTLLVSTEVRILFSLRFCVSIFSLTGKEGAGSVRYLTIFKRESTLKGANSNRTKTRFLPQDLALPQKKITVVFEKEFISKPEDKLIPTLRLAEPVRPYTRAR